MEFPFLRTYKPMLKRARGTPSYQDVRQLIKLWMHCQHMTQLLHRQNTNLYQASRDRDLLLWEKHHVEGCYRDLTNYPDIVVVGK